MNHWRSPLFALTVSVLMLGAAPLYAGDSDDEQLDDTESQQPTDEADGSDSDQPEDELTEAEQQLLEAADEITEQVVDIRGLAPESSIPRGVKNRDQLRAVLMEQFEQEVADQEFDAEERVYRRLGLLQPESDEDTGDEQRDYRQLLLDLMTEQIAGFYDYQEGELYIMKGLPEALQHSTMAHELFHAIQDQHFDISELLEPFSPQENADFSLARMALIEGDATVLMIDYELYEEGVLPQNQAKSFIDVPRIAAAVLELDPMQLAAIEQLDPGEATGPDQTAPSLPDTELANAPPIVRDPLLFPYIDGMRFVVRARSGRNWEEFNRLYDQPPVSTSQILHPEQYFDGVEPIDIEFDASAALEDYEPVYDTVFGELKIRSWMATHIDERRQPAEAPRHFQGGLEVIEHLDDDTLELPDAAPIAEGWRGDRIRGYEGPDGEFIVAHLSSWESADDAETFARALETTLRERHDTSSDHTGGDHGEAWCIRPGDMPRGERHFVERWGELVLYIEGAPSRLDDEGRETDATTYLMREGIWETHRRAPFEEVLEARADEPAEDAEPTDEVDQPDQTDDPTPGDQPGEAAGQYLDCTA